MARGQPQRPAPVSGPSALSRRTDGGAGSDTQPIRTPTGGGYGEAKALTDQQRAAPLAATPGAALAAPGSNAGQGAPVPTPGVFGPTERPGESPHAGLMTGPQAIAEDVDGFLRVVYSVFDHPAIAALLRQE